ncbi:aspartate/glutamate racemase family protein [Maritalea myrionectae]|uniref:aspartate/glutamate racemase family protein n=1 Tax=Maritalea myrionectae TaxID=454601 RepID=UPI00042964FF|nr:aspartate/glutamate racemase family protein [Maritalea myrionectae]
MPKILVINPNSSKSVTQSMAHCLAEIDGRTSHDIICIELSKSPPGIETDEHVAEVVPHILEAVAASDADAFVIACFSDPGIAKVRATTNKPVFGIAESAYLTALSLGSAFGIISMGPSSIGRHLRYLQHLQLDKRLAGDRAINITVPELMTSNVIEGLGETGRALRDQDGADVLILGCAGLGNYRQDLQALLQLPVVDPVQAGVMHAINALDLNYGGNV